MMGGKFREDLFFRINVMSITLPPLRERKDQVLPLSLYFFNLYKKKFGKSSPWLSAETIDLFKKYNWPGNIRELENMIKRIILFGERVSTRSLIPSQNNDEIDPSYHDGFTQNGTKGLDFLNLKKVRREATESAEKELMQKTLNETHWNRKEAARLLQVSYKALLYKIQKYNLDGL